MQMFKEWHTSIHVTHTHTHAHSHINKHAQTKPEMNISVSVFMNMNYLPCCHLVEVAGKQCRPRLVSERRRVISHNATTVFG